MWPIPAIAAGSGIVSAGDLDIAGAPPGDYVPALTLSDKFGSGAASAKLSFTIR